MENYTVVRQIGRGNFGSVFLVQEKDSHEAPPLQWVVKKIAIFGMSPEEARRAKARTC
jgi:serine/threonine protein kinase